MSAWSQHSSDPSHSVATNHTFTASTTTTQLPCSVFTEFSISSF